MTKTYGDTKLPAAVPISSVDIPEKISADDVLQRIDAAIDQVEDTPEPGLMHQIVNPGARSLAIELRNIQALKIKARREHVEQLMGLIKVYVEAHKQSLKVRSAAYVQYTFHTLEGPLYAAAERAVVSFWATFTQNLAKVEAMPLTDEQKIDYGTRAYASVLAATDDTRQGYVVLLNKLRTEFVGVRKEIES